MEEQKPTSENSKVNILNTASKAGQTAQLRRSRNIIFVCLLGQLICLIHEIYWDQPTVRSMVTLYFAIGSSTYCLLMFNKLIHAKK